ncbi:YbhB/YbcL family Raf kinase inhibitor-like protein [Oxalicibacterium faecigallinarum]|uniref:Phosphatidylethanolamine-binding protein n=1 Tax=Oxalicibacterium faecigallinarum TaxID=573741 RepID=A0A8J3F2E2_9BURK|nr:YbhB/YbcL family Raf kinase inhibitor-like protein [Oxalicibacterium faecigallinarum]GGI21155.1 phosphatidylethanolamine-binding protein [Oxalicibacterium faecigallinarum]
MKLWSDSFKDGEAIPGEFAFCVADPTNHVAMSANRNPHLAWSDVPAATRSLAIIVHDPDVPSRGDDVNQEGKTVPVDLPRVDFYHWTLIDLPTDLRNIAAGSFANGITPRGKSGPAISDSPIANARHGINDYTGWFAQDKDMSGNYFGYDGPCPPWNDAIAHRYVFTVYALDIEHVAVDGNFTGPDVLAAISGHVLAEASLTGWYSLNPAVAATPTGKV